MPCCGNQAADNPASRRRRRRAVAPAECRGATYPRLGVGPGLSRRVPSSPGLTAPGRERPNIYKVPQVKRKYFPRPRLRVTAVPGLPLPCCVRRSWPTFSVTPDLLSAAGAVAASARRGAGRLHPTSIGTPAARRPEERRRLCRGLTILGRSRYSFVPGSAAIQGVWLVPPRRASRSSGLAAGAGRPRAVARGLLATYPFGSSVKSLL